RLLAGPRPTARQDQRARHAHDPGEDEGGAGGSEPGMTTTETGAATEAPAEQTRREAMEAKLVDLHAEQTKAVEAGGKYISRHRERGKLTARERIDLLVDEGSAFLELMPLAGWGSDFAVGASLVTGIGVVE